MRGGGYVAAALPPPVALRSMAAPTTWSFPTLRHLDLRGVRAVSVEGGQVKVVGDINWPLTAPGGLPCLHTLLVGFHVADAEVNKFNVSEFALWPSARRLAILVVERARIIMTHGVGNVKAGMAAFKPALVSVHLHECTVRKKDEAGVQAFVKGCQRVCRCGRVEECLFGAD